MVFSAEIVFLLISTIPNIEETVREF
ncbi:hypothetical protein LINPERHAP1_LOCUS44237 [Linum perenne]